MSNSKVLQNTIANFAGQGWGVIISFVLIPIYLKMLGIESFGLIGVYGMLSSIIGLLDLGISANITRELAILSATINKRDIPITLRSFESIYWPLGLMIIILAIPFAHLITSYWINPQDVTQKVVQYAVIFMLLEIGVRFPSGLYLGCMYGLQKQVQINIYNAFFDSFRHLSTLLMLIYFSNTIVIYFICQAVNSLLKTLCFCFLTWHMISPKSMFSTPVSLLIIKKSLKFTLAMSGVTISNLVYSQMDKIILSKLLTLENFGYYSLVLRVTSSMSSLLMHPILLSVNPKMSQLVSVGNENDRRKFFHVSCQLITLAVIPISMIVIYYSYDLMLLWTKNSQIAHESRYLLSLLVFASLFPLMGAGPWIIRYAYGKVSLAALLNVVCAIIILPLLLFAIKYGLIGVGITVAVVNIIYFIIISKMTFKYYFKTESMNWLFKDILIPFLMCFVTVSLFYYLGQKMKTNSYLWILLTGIIAFVSTLAMTKEITDMMKKFYTKRWRLS